MWKSIDKQDTDTEPFLSPVEDVPDQNRPAQKYHTINKFYAVHAVIFTINVVLAAILLFRVSLPSSETHSHGMYNPIHSLIIDYAYALYKVFAKDAIRYKKTTFLSSAETGLTGPPNPEMDTSWDRLLDDASIRLTSNEVPRFNSSSIDLQESEGKLAWLEISHQVHCVVSHLFLYMYFTFDIKNPAELYSKSYVPQLLLCQSFGARLAKFYHASCWYVSLNINRNKQGHADD